MRGDRFIFYGFPLAVACLLVLLGHGLAHALTEPRRASLEAAQAVSAHVAANSVTSRVWLIGSNGPGSTTNATVIVASNALSGAWLVITNNQVTLTNSVGPTPDEVVPLEFAAMLIIKSLERSGHTNIHMRSCYVVTGEWDGETRCFVYRLPGGVVGALVDHDGKSGAQPWALTNAISSGKALHL